MKLLFMLLFMVSTLTTSIEEVDQEPQTITATYVGTQEGVFYFTNDETEMAFQSVDYEVAELINLDDEAYKGKTFDITYTTETEEDEAGEEVEINTIVKLVPAE